MPSPHMSGMLINMKNIIFMGTPQFAVPILEELIKEIPATLHVFSKPDTARGRGQKTSPSPVKQCAENHNLPVYTPKTKEDLMHEVTKITPDLIIVVAYAVILPKIITDHFICINIHASILPQYRGASPIHTALLNQDKITGITLIRMNEKMDEGDILKVKNVTISSHDTLETLEKKLSKESSLQMVNYIKKNPHLKKVSGRTQEHEKASYCYKITKDKLIININNDIKKNLGKIKAFSPKPGARITHNGKIIKIIDAKIENNKIKSIHQAQSKESWLWAV